MTSLNECFATFLDARLSHFKTHWHSHVSAKRGGRNCILYRIDNILPPTSFFSISFRFVSFIYSPFSFRLQDRRQGTAASCVFYIFHQNVQWSRQCDLNEARWIVSCANSISFHSILLRPNTLKRCALEHLMISFWNALHRALVYIIWYESTWSFSHTVMFQS